MNIYAQLMCSYKKFGNVVLSCKFKDHSHCKKNTNEKADGAGGEL